LVPQWIEAAKTDIFTPPKPFFMREYICELYDPKLGIIVGRGRGSCNLFEKKYYNMYTGKFKGDPYVLHNTIIKMAKKRALIDATLTLPGVSMEFTQDMEDIVDK